MPLRDVNLAKLAGDQFCNLRPSSVWTVSIKGERAPPPSFSWESRCLTLMSPLYQGVKLPPVMKTGENILLLSGGGGVVKSISEHRGPKIYAHHPGFSKYSSLFWGIGLKLSFTLSSGLQKTSLPVYLCPVRFVLWQIHKKWQSDELGLWELRSIWCKEQLWNVGPVCPCTTDSPRKPESSRDPGGYVLTVV